MGVGNNAILRPSIYNDRQFKYNGYIHNICYNTRIFLETVFQQKINKETKGNVMSEDGIENLEVTDMPDGSAKVTMDITPETQRVLMKQGLEYLIDEMKVNDKVVVMEPNEFSKDAKTWELSDDEYNALFHFGFISALKLGMDGLEQDD